MEKLFSYRMFFVFFLTFLFVFVVSESTETEIKNIVKRGLSDDEGSSAAIGILPPCVICGSKSTGINYGEPTCSNCQRAVSKIRLSNLKMYCKKGGNCDVTFGNTQSRCRVCKFEKAKKLGMNVEKSRIESQSNVATDTNFLANSPGPSQNFFFPTSHQDDFLRSNTVRKNMFSSPDTLKHSAESQDHSELTGAPFPNAYWCSQGNVVGSSTFSGGVLTNEGLQTARLPSAYREDEPRRIQKVPYVSSNDFSQDFSFNKISMASNNPSKFQSNIRQFTEPASFIPFSSLDHSTSHQLTAVSEALRGFPLTSTSTMVSENSENDLPKHSPPSRGFQTSNQQNYPNTALDLSLKGSPEEAATSCTSSSGNSSQKDDTKPSASKNNEQKFLNSFLEFLKHRQEKKE